MASRQPNINATCLEHRQAERPLAPLATQALGILDAVNQPFDAILLDLQMPSMNGVEFIDALSQRAAHRETSVVVATSEKETSELVQEARWLGWLRS